MEMSKVCTVNLIVRKLETSVMEITPNIITMESETVLTQYIITNWTLAYNNASNVDSGIQGERQVNHHGRTITVGGGKGKQKKDKVKW